MLSDQDRIRLEKAFLGAALLTNNLAPAKTIRPEMLTSPKRQAILKAMLVAGARGEQFDAISLACDLSTGPEPAPKIGWLPTIAGYLDDMCADMGFEYAERIRVNFETTRAHELVDRFKNGGNPSGR